MSGLALTNIVALLTQYGYAIIFPISIIEGPIVAVIAGFLVSLGRLNWFVTFCILMAGDIVGDTFYYALGRWGGRGFIRRWGKYIGVSEARVRSLEHYFYAHNWKILTFAKTQAVGSAILFSAGVAQMPFGKYIWYNLLSSLPKVALFEIIGFYFGRGLTSVNMYVNYAGALSFIAAVALLGAYWFIKKYINSKNRELGL